MEQFDYIKFVNENRLLKETDGYGSYKNPKTMLEFDGQDDFYINVSVRDAKKALEILRDEFSNEIRSKIIQLEGSDSYVINDREVAMDLFDAFKLQGIEIIDTDVEVEDSDFDDDGELGPDEELMEAKQEWAVKNIEAMITDYASQNGLKFRPVDKKQQVNQFGSKKTIYFYKLGDKDLVMIDDKAAGAPRLNNFVVGVGTVDPSTSSLKDSLSVSKFGSWGVQDVVRMLDKAFGKEEVKEETIQEANVPENIKRFAKKKGVSALVNKLAGWAEKAGKRIVGGTAIGKNYDTLILDLTHNGGEIRIDTVEESIEVNDYPVNNYASFLNALNNSQDSEDSIEEGSPSSYPRAEFSDAVHKALEAGLDKEELHRIVNFG